MGLSNEVSWEAGSFSCCCNPHRFFQSEVLRLYFPCTGTLGCMVCLTPQLFLLVYLHTNVRPPGPPATTLLRVLSTAAVPPTGLDECFFNSFVVGLPYSFISGSSGYFFAFKCIVVLLLVVQGGKVYLPTPPSWPEVALCLLFVG